MNAGSAAALPTGGEDMTLRIPSMPISRLNRLAGGRLGGAVRSEIGRTVLVMIGAALLASVAVGVYQNEFVEHGPPDLAGMLPPEAAMGMPPGAALGGPPAAGVDPAAGPDAAPLGQAIPLVVFLTGSAEQAEQAEREADAPRKIALIAGTAEEAALAQQLVKVMQLQFGEAQVQVVDLR
jgi:hypothetical protein